MSSQGCPHCEAGWCSLGYANVRRRENNKGHQGYRAPGHSLSVEERIMAMSRSVGPGKPGAPQMYELSDWAVNYPKVWEQLTEELFDDGTKRQVSTLLLLGEDGWFKACLNDRAEGRVGWVSGKTMESVLDALEQKLRDGGMDWRRVEVKTRK